MKMKWFLLAFVLAAIVPIYGQGGNTKTQNDYWCIFSPENLPNTILCVIGFAGVIAAVCTLKAIKVQAVLMTQQVVLMNKEFVCTHPPKLVIRELQMLPSTIHPRVTIGYIISNSGSTSATIVESIIEVQKIDSGAAGPLRNTDGLNTIENDTDNVLAYPNKSLTIEPGDFTRYRHSSEITFKPDPPLAPGAPIVTKAPNSYPWLYFRGRVVYSDGNGTKKQMESCRQYKNDSESFIPLAEYEFSD